MTESDDQDETPSNEFAISIGDDLLAEALSAVEKRLYSKNSAVEGDETEVEFDIEVEIDDGGDFDNLLGGDNSDDFSSANVPKKSTENKTAALLAELSNIKAQLLHAKEEQQTAVEAARDAKDETRRTLLKQKRLIDSNAQLSLDVRDLNDTQKQWEQMVSELRAQAAEQDSERVNHRNRLKRDVADAKRSSTERVLKYLMIPMDHIDLALKHFGKDNHDSAILEGFIAAIQELRAGLSKAGLSIIDATPGSVFNPGLHEAIARVYSDEVPRTHIVEEHRRGFLLEGKLYRPSQVTVSGGDDPDLIDNGASASED